MLPLFFVLAILPGVLKGAQIIENITVTGVDKTRPAFLLRQSGLSPGDACRVSRVKKGEQGIYNTGLCKTVHSTITTVEQGCKVNYHCDEVYSIIPNFRFGSSPDQNWWEAGMTENNLLGRGARLKAVFLYRNRNGGAVYYEDPEVLSARWGLIGEYKRIPDHQSVEIEDSRIPYKILKQTVIPGISYKTASSVAKLTLASGILQEEFRKDSSSELGPDVVDKKKQISSVTLDTDLVNDHYGILEGYQSQLKLEHTSDGGDPFFWKVRAELKAYYILTPAIYLAHRGVAGTSPDRSSPFLAFALDDQLNVRGAGKQRVRGTGLGVYNIELRKSWHTSEVIWQGVVFADQGIVLPRKHRAFTFGLGGRALIRSFYGVVLRSDLAFNSNTGEKSLHLGTGHFF